jgi:GT2 family glycosyltransferase
VRVIANEENVGYGPALNQAIAAMEGDFFLALNTDIRLHPDYVANLVRCIARHDAGYAQGKILYMDQDLSPTNTIYSTGHLITRGRLVYNRGVNQRDKAQYEMEEPIPGANGAAVLMTRAMIRDLGRETELFDPLFFLYGNDADLDWLAASRGWKCFYLPRAVAWHIGEASSGITERGFDARYVNVRFLMMIKNDRIADFLMDLPHIIKANVIDLAPKIVRKPSLIFRIPLDLIRALPDAIRSRRTTGAAKHSGGKSMRDWFRWSTELLRRERT